MHVPPVGEPQSLEEMTFAIEEIVKLVCWGTETGASASQSGTSVTVSAE